MKIRKNLKTFLGIMTMLAINLTIISCDNGSGGRIVSEGSFGSYDVNITASKDTIDDGEEITLTTTVKHKETIGAESKVTTVDPSELLFSWGPTEADANSWVYIKSIDEKNNTFTFKGKNESGKSQNVTINCVVTKKDGSKVGSCPKIILVKSK